MEVHVTHILTSGSFAEYRVSLYLPQAVADLFYTHHFFLVQPWSNISSPSGIMQPKVNSNSLSDKVTESSYSRNTMTTGGKVQFTFDIPCMHSQPLYQIGELNDEIGFFPANRIRLETEQEEQCT